MEFLLLAYFLLALACFFSVLAERNRKKQSKLNPDFSSESLESDRSRRESERMAAAMNATNRHGGLLRG